MRSKKIVIKGNELQSFRKSPIILFVLLNTFFRLNVNLTSKITPICIWESTWETMLLLISKVEFFAFFNFLLDIIPWDWLLWSELKVIFHWKAKSLIFFRSLLFNSITDSLISWTTKNKKVSSANSLAFDDKSSHKSSI